jgi:hypothetical protein
MSKRGLVSVVLVAAVGAAVTVARHHDRPAGPDVAAVARSAGVEAAGAAAAGRLDDRMSTITAFAVDMTPVATSVRDVCVSRPVGASVGRAYGPVSCTRTVTRYFSFGGIPAPRRTGWDAALRAAGWQGNEPEAAPADPDGWRLPLVYREPGTGLTLGVGWERRPQAPTFWDPQETHTGDLVAVRADQPVDAAATAAAAYREEPFMAMAMLQSTYYDAA